MREYHSGRCVASAWFWEIESQPSSRAESSFHLNFLCYYYWGLWWVSLPSHVKGVVNCRNGKTRETRLCVCYFGFAQCTPNTQDDRRINIMIMMLPRCCCYVALSVWKGLSSLSWNKCMNVNACILSTVVLYNSLGDNNNNTTNGNNSSSVHTEYTHTRRKKEPESLAYNNTAYGFLVFLWNRQIGFTESVAASTAAAFANANCQKYPQEHILYQSKSITN